MIRLIACAALILAVSAQASEQLARQELAKYAPNQRATFAIEQSADESFSIAKDGDAVRMVGSNDFMLLAGTYHLLDQLGCRFLAPKFDHYRGSAEVIPESLDGKITPVTRKPKLKFRKLYVEEGHSHDIQNLKQLVEWMPKVGYNTLVIPTDYGGSGRVRWDNWREQLTPELQKRGITIEVGGHGYENFINAEMEDGGLFKQHPDWFGKDEKGVPQRAKKAVFCTSNAAAVEYVTNNVIAYLKARPEIQIFDFWPPDGAKWCVCDACKKLGEPPDRQSILLKQVTEKLKPVRPDVRLEIIAYSSYLEPPKNVPVDESVLVDFCPINQHFDAQIDDANVPVNTAYADALQAWRKSFAGDISVYSYYRKYAWDSLPVVIPHYMQKDLQFYAKVPVQGVSVYSEPADWFTYELNHYVLAALGWDPDADVEALVEKFCDARYGRHSKIGFDALMTLQDTVRVYGSVPHVPLKAAFDIDAAQQKVKHHIWQLSAAQRHGGTDAEMLAVNRLLLMCTYAQRDLEIQQMRANNAPREQIVAAAKKLHAWVKSHADDGVFLCKGNRLNQNRMLTRYGVAEPK
jgi:hypothetical protein